MTSSALALAAASASMRAALDRHRPHGGHPDVGKHDRAQDAPLARRGSRGRPSGRGSPRTVLDELAKITPEAELACVASILTSIETDLSKA